MTERAVGVLHPGAMGATVARTIAAGGHPVYWCGDGRSDATAERARAAGAEGVATLGGLAERCSVLVSVCPPAAALALAQTVRAAGFRGVYVDANAVSPARAAAIADCIGRGYVDGGIVGPPARQPGTTRLYLSGGEAPAVAALFAAGPLEARLLDAGTTTASALKMCFAAYTKGSSALLLGVRALAEAHGVGAALEDEWALSQINGRLR